MWGGKKARAKYNLDDIEVDEYDRSSGSSSIKPSNCDYSENDVWHMLYGIREGYMDVSLEVRDVSVRKWTDGTFDITLSVNADYHSYNDHSRDYIDNCVNRAANNLLNRAERILSNKGINASISIRS